MCYFGNLLTGKTKLLHNHTSQIAEELDSVKGHVPRLLWHYKFTEPTSEIREALGVSEPKRGSRVLYILVFPKLQPITDLQGADFFNVLKQCILCTWFVVHTYLFVELVWVAGHYDLWQAGVHHRDVSPANLMWYRKGSVLMGVLNDYDLSSLATSVQGPQGNQRTGTIPFMAVDLLTQRGEEVQHLYRHDLESFMWVLVWVALRYKNGRLLPRKNRPFDDWVAVDAKACGGKKLLFRDNIHDYAPFAKDERIWGLIVGCFHVLHTESVRREGVSIEQQQLWPEGGRQIVTEKIELDDHEFLDLFMATMAWVQLSLE